MEGDGSRILASGSKTVDSSGEINRSAGPDFRSLRNISGLALSAENGAGSAAFPLLLLKIISSLFR